MLVREHGFEPLCFNADNYPPQAEVCQTAPLGNRSLADLVNNILQKAAYHCKGTTTGFVRLFDMAAIKKREKVKVRPIVDRAYYLSAEFEEKHIASMQGLATDPGYVESLAAWHVTVGDGLAQGESS